MLTYPLFRAIAVLREHHRFWTRTARAIDKHVAKRSERDTSRLTPEELKRWMADGPMRLSTRRWLVPAVRAAMRDAGLDDGGGEGQ